MNKGLIVSCQASPGDPLYSPFIMGRMAAAAKQGGAVGIRAGGVADILEIKKNVDLPIIGIIKKAYPGRKPYITPTRAEIDALIKTDIEVIALDATIDQDESLLKALKEKYPGQKFMADISTPEEGIRADRIGIDYIGTTLVGYTEQSKNTDKFTVLKELIRRCKRPIIAEGNFNTPEEAAAVIEMGAYAVVVGTAITKPQCITKWFADAVETAAKS